MIKVLCAAVLVATSMPAMAAVTASGDDEDKKERLVCKRSAETATRTRSARVCKTAAQWRATTRKAEKDNKAEGGDLFLSEGTQSQAQSAGGSPR